MKNTLGLLTIMVFFLVGCESPKTTLQGSNEDQNNELPATWTIKPTNIPEPTLYEQDFHTDTITTTPTPDSILPTPTQILSSKPSKTPYSFQDYPVIKKGVDITITDISMSTAERGWAIGYQMKAYPYILHTQDGGKSWQDRTPPVKIISGENYYGDNVFGYFPNTNDALVIINNTKDELEDNHFYIWKSENEGITWIPGEIFEYSGFDIYNVSFSFIDSAQGWLLIQTGLTHMHDLSFLFSTDDGGENWLLVNRPGNSMIEVLANTGIAYANKSNGWVTKDELAFGFGPFLEQTLDGGLNWEKVFLPSPEGRSWDFEKQSCQTMNPVFTSPQVGYVLVQCFNYDEELNQFIWEDPITYIHATSDWGDSWEISEFPSSLNQLIFINTRTGFAMGIDHYKTINGGADWIKYKTVAWDGQFNFINASEGWAIARRDEQIALLHTIDGGLSYQEINPIISH